MVDNTGEEISDHLTNTQSEPGPDEVASPVDTENNSLNQEAENMEVHHHPKVEKKNFKEYILEFIMIFLAVTMGFIAENVREHFTENKIVHQNLEAYRNDLLQHQEYYKSTTAEFKNQLPVYDSLVEIFFEKNENSQLPLVSRLILQGTLNYVVTINTPTYAQLISSGSLRFLESKELKAIMASYQGQINSYINYNDRILNLINSDNVEMGKIIDYHDFWAAEKMTNFQIYSPVIEPFTLTKEQRNSIIAYNKIYSVQFQAGLSQINKLLKSNEALIQLLDKELEK